MTYDHADPAQALEAAWRSREALADGLSKPWRSRGLWHEQGLLRAPLPAAPVGFAAGWFGSGLWLRVYRRELAEHA